MLLSGDMEHCEIIAKNGARHPRISVTEQIIDRYPSAKSVLDVGAGHCLFSLAAAAKGLRVTAVDVRTDRKPANLEASGISFIQADINNPYFDPSGHDLILLLGILYHLTVEEQLAVLKKCSSTVTIIDTHYVLEATVTQLGFGGSIYIENDQTRSDPRSAWTSAESFWPTLESLEQMLQICGYRRICKVEPELETRARSFFICEP